MNEPVLVSVSGGKDSTAALLWAIENLPNNEIYTVFADTGNECEVTLEYVDYLEQAIGLKIVRVKAKRQFEEMLLNDKQYFPSSQVRWCTKELKKQPIKDYLNRVFPELTSLVDGQRRDESRTRECLPDWEWDEEYRTDIWHPIAAWNTSQVFDIAKRHGIKPNPLYRQGFSRVGCMPCIKARKREVELIARLYPHHIDKIRRWESIVDRGRTFFTGRTIDEVLMWSGACQLEWAKTENEKCMSVYGLCE